MHNNQYVFHSDPGHGWLAVKRSELVELGITARVTSYSYQKGNTVYLEEDCDAQLFVTAHVGKYGVEPLFRGSYQKYSPIRSYQRFQEQQHEQRTS